MTTAAGGLPTLRGLGAVLREGSVVGELRPKKKAQARAFCPLLAPLSRVQRELENALLRADRLWKEGGSTRHTRGSGPASPPHARRRHL